jgi:hypothetical protein
MANLPNLLGTFQATYPLGTPWSGSTPSPTYSNTFIPILWSSKLIDKFYDSSVIAAICNTDYEGEIKSSGDHVVIRQRPDVSVAAYSADMDLVIERPSADIVELLIDKGFYWNTALDDVMEVQSDINMMNMWSQDASEQMRVAIDTEVLDYIYPVLLAGAATYDTAGTTAGRISQNINLGVTTAPITLTYSGTGPTAPTATTQDIMDFILRMAQVLDEHNAPETGRFLVLPAWACQMLKASDLRMANEMGDSTSIYRNGQIGTVDRMSIYKSNLLPTAASTQTTLAAGEHVIFCGTTHGATFASQVTKVETLRSERSFSNLMRGLQVYGRKVVNERYLVGAVVKAG